MQTGRECVSAMEGCDTPRTEDWYYTITPFIEFEYVRLLLCFIRVLVNTISPFSNHNPIRWPHQSPPIEAYNQSRGRTEWKQVRVMHTFIIRLGYPALLCLLSCLGTQGKEDEERRSPAISAATKHRLLANPGGETLRKRRKQLPEYCQSRH
ncbi:hypothetical protein M404DRAFT_329390 [Pisolithus tinctorius Marx 270]|uniref:Uncharacterized protein n=1 Tax=Pisolithus tinctorius Marx 270 TaxID=870435 RepID=A0A0C3PKW6_PISTI|nr:hypothetical protein M404DRAFT_329390 [Pisolithus tinctorius Marx 270]